MSPKKQIFPLIVSGVNGLSLLVTAQPQVHYFIFRGCMCVSVHMLKKWSHFLKTILGSGSERKLW